MEWIKNNLPIISLLLLVVGTVNLMIFYTYFNIDILAYLEFTEVIQLQFKTFAIAIAIFLSISFILVVHSKIHRKIFLHDEGNSEDPIDTAMRERYEQAALQRKKKGVPEPRQERIILLSVKFVFIAIHILGIILLVIFPVPNEFVFPLLCYSIACVVMSALVAYFEIKWMLLLDNKEGAIKPDFRLIKALLTSIVLIYSSGIYSYYLASTHLSTTSSNEVSITIENKTISTNANYRYLGQTKNYVFFYDILKKQAQIFPVSDIKTVFISNGVNYKPNLLEAPITDTKK